MENLSWKKAQTKINQGLVFLEFFTPWCADCKMMEPVLEDLEAKIKASNLAINFIKVDAEEANFFRDPKADFAVLKVPSCFLLIDGRRYHLGYEYLPAEVLFQKLQQLIKQP